MQILLAPQDNMKFFYAILILLQQVNEFSSV